ncbi:MAG TPA: hypothetical protein VER12_05670 [Polyangiaceae bacterium]|nr:hypothetical protein [Polyangiaceae bacterium]
MRTPLSVIAAALLSCTVVGCGDSVEAHSGASEPLTVSNGQFFDGSYPSDQGGPLVTSTSGYRSKVFSAGTVAKSFGGNAAEGALSIAVALQGLGSGYWVAPVGSPDQETEGELTWKVLCNFAHDLPPGTHNLVFAAANRDGQFGPQSLLEVTSTSFLPQGHVVASLSWGNDADVDLHLISPSGKELDPKHLSTTAIDEDTMLPAPGAGTLDRDSIANCVLDGRRNENIVWATDATEPPEAGTYTVIAHLFNSCGRPATNFVFDLFVDGQVTQHEAGVLLDIDADNGSGPGLYVTQFSL